MNLKVFFLLIAFGALLAYFDNVWQMETILVEIVHGLVVSAIFVFAIICQIKYPEMKQVGWTKIVWGLGFLMIGSWVDILDDPPVVAVLQSWDIPFGRSWEQAFLKKILGYTGGISLIAYGFFEWIPWMIDTKTNMQKLNQKLGTVNKEMNRLLMTYEEHIESERLNISRELHDDLAQRLTFLNFQLQLCQKEIADSGGSDKLKEQLRNIGQELGETLKTVRQICRDLRPEPLFALGLIPALEQFIEKIRQQTPEVGIMLDYRPLADTDGHVRFESRFNERELLHLFRILQEGIRNCIKHSQAETIDVVIEETSEQFLFQIQDDGIGLPWTVMPSDETLVQNGHLGVVGLKERIKELAGTFSLANNASHGACMEITIAK